jgi:iron complex transport system ATP-binding protein
MIYSDCLEHRDGSALMSWRNVYVIHNHKYLLQNVCFDLFKNDLIAIVGPNGAGKSTLLRTAAGLVRPKGYATILRRQACGLNGRERSMLISYLPQQRDLVWPMSARDVVSLGIGAFAKQTQADLARIDICLRELGILHLGDKPMSNLSGGERARVSLARALVSSSPILIADEPLSSLDPAAQLHAMEALAHRAESGRPVIAAFHEISLALRYASKILVVHNGRMLACAPPDVIMESKALSYAFGVEFSFYSTPHGYDVTFDHSTADE